jgi:hypothetical protein
MAHLDGVAGVVVVVKPRYRSRGQCTCGWMGKPRLLLSSAKVDALIHAARRGCEPAVPLIQPDVMIMMKRRGMLDVDSPQDGLAPAGSPLARKCPLPLAYRCSNTTARAGANQRYWGNSS